MNLLAWMQGRLARVERYAPWILVAAAAAYRLWAWHRAGKLDGFDESVYRYMSEVVGEQGIAGLRMLIARYPHDPVLSLGPQPLRVLHVGLCVLVSKILGGYTQEHLVYLSFVSGVGVVAVGWLLCRRWLGARPALLATALLVTSPLAVALGRRALQDVFFSLVVLVVVLCFERARERPRPSRLVLLGLALVAGFLTKESIAFVYPVLIAGALLGTLVERRLPPLRLALPLALAPLVSLAILVLLAGSLASVLDLFRASWRLSHLNDYALRFQQGPWFRYLVDLLLLAPIPVLLAAFGLAGASGEREEGRLPAVYAVASFAVFGALWTANVRYILFIDVFLRALAAVGVVQLTARLRRWEWASSATVLALTGVALWHDGYQFSRIFEYGNIYDPITVNLIWANGMQR